MATYTEWNITASQYFSGANIGQFELAVRNSSLVYRMIDPDYIVELDTIGSAVRQWQIPSAALGIAGPAAMLNIVGIDIGADGHVWLAPKMGLGLLELDPASGDFTLHQWNTAGTASPPMPPFDLPCRLRFDESGTLWFAFNGGTSNVDYRPVIGHLTPGAATVDLWEVQVPLAGGVDVWPHAKSNAVWFSFSCQSTLANPPVLGRLDTKANHVDYWTLGRAASNKISSVALVGDSLKAPRNLWIALNPVPGPGPGPVLRYEVARHRFFVYREPGMMPLDIDLDSGRNAWATNTDGRIYRIHHKTECESVRLAKKSADAPSATWPLTDTTANVQAQNVQVVRTDGTVFACKQKCFDAYLYSRPNPVWPMGGVTTGTPRGQDVFYALPDTLGIGRLTP